MMSKSPSLLVASQNIHIYIYISLVEHDYQSGAMMYILYICDIYIYIYMWSDYTLTVDRNRNIMIKEDYDETVILLCDANNI